jgi:hypothetical protein
MRVSVRRRIFLPERKEITLGWGKLHNEEFHNLLAYVVAVQTYYGSPWTLWSSLVITEG